MKKIVSFFIAILLLSLYGCADNNNRSDQSEKSVEPAIRYIAAYEDYYKNGLIYAVGGNFAHTRYVDFETLESTAFCNAPNCTHQTSSCVARQVGIAPVIYNDNAFFFVSNVDVVETKDERKLVIDSSLKKMNLSDFEIENVVSFNDVTVYNGEGCVLINNNLYFVGCDENPNEDSYGNLSWSNVGGKNYICCIDLDTGKYENLGLICDVEDEYPLADSTGTAKILGYYKGHICIGYSFMKEEGKWSLLSFKYNPETKKITENELPYASYIKDDTYVYCKDNSLIAIIGNDEYKFENCPQDIYTPVFNEKIFTIDSWYDLSNGSEHSLGEYTGCGVYAYYNNGYIIQNKNNQFVKLTEEELLALDKEK